MTSRISVAPMMDWTDRHCRYFMRQLSGGVRLFTEMVTAAAIHHGDKESLLRFDSSEHPVAIQLGGSDPQLMVGAAMDAAAAGYDEVNINVGCRSSVTLLGFRMLNCWLLILRSEAWLQRG